MPKIDPDNLTSKNTARLVEIVSEGPIKGLANGLKSIFYGDTPLQDVDGDLNFQGASTTFRNGTADQAPVPGFSMVEQEVSDGREIRNVAPVFFTVDNLEASAIRIKFNFPRIVWFLEDGDQKGLPIKLSVHVSNDGGATYYKAKIIDVFGKSSGPYEVANRVEFRGEGPWTVRVERESEDNTYDSTRYWQSYLRSYTVIIDAKLTYPMSAYVAHAFDAENFGSSIPERSYVIDGKLIRIPNNYNPTTRKYAGIWDGTFKVEWSNNPAWVFYDLLVDKRYGLGRDIPMTIVDKWKLYEIAQYCDQDVTSGGGTVEPRFTCNCIIKGSRDAYEVLNELVSCFRGMIYWSSGQISFSADMPADPVALITKANVVDGLFNYSGSAKDVRSTIAYVSWINPDNNYEVETEVYEDSAGVARYGYRPVKITSFACTSPGQARRTAKWLVDTNLNATEVVTWKASFDHFTLKPGDIVKISDPDTATTRLAGRVVSVNNGGGGVVLDTPIAVSVGYTYKIEFILADGTIFETNITNDRPHSGADITLGPNIPSAIIPGAIWMLSIIDYLEPRQFKVLSISESQSNILELTAVVHDRNKYDRVENDLQLDEAPFSGFRTGVLLPPARMDLDRKVFKRGTSTVTAAEVLWVASQDARVQLYEVYINTPNMKPGVYRLIDTTSETSYIFENVIDGMYGFRVRATAPNVAPSKYIDGFKNFYSEAYAPPDVTGFVSNVLSETVLLQWNPVKWLDVDHYQIRFIASAPAGASWERATILFEEVSSATNYVKTNARLGTYFIKAVNSRGQKSDAAAVTTVWVKNLPNTNVIEELEEHPNWNGLKDRVGLVNRAISLRRNPVTGVFYSEGYYYFQKFVDLGSVVITRMLAEIVAGGTDPANTIASWVPIASAQPLSSAYSDEWDVALEIAISQNGTTFSTWQKFTVGDYTGRAFKFRLYLRTFAPGETTATVFQTKVSVEMLDRVERGQAIKVEKAGKLITFDAPFFAAPAVTVVGNQSTAQRVVISDKTEESFRVTVFDEEGTPIEAEIDFISSGYGRRMADFIPPEPPIDVILRDDTYETLMGESMSLRILDNDINAQLYNIVITTYPEHGTLDLTQSSGTYTLTYAPSAGYAGVDGFKYALDLVPPVGQEITEASVVIFVKAEPTEPGEGSELVWNEPAMTIGLIWDERIPGYTTPIIGSIDAPTLSVFDERIGSLIQVWDERTSNFSNVIVG